MVRTELFSAGFARVKLNGESRAATDAGNIMD